MSEQVRDLPAPRNPFARLIGVIVSPRETLEEIARQPGWLSPFACYLVVLVVALAAYSMKADFLAIYTEQFETSAIMKLLPEDRRDQAIAEATEGFRKMSHGQLAAQTVLSGGGNLLPFLHLMTLVYCTLFVFMGSLPRLRLGSAWRNFLLCLLTLVGFIAVYGIAVIAFKDSPQSMLLLVGTATVLMTGGWAWLLNRHASRDEEFHKVLSVCVYSAAVSIVWAVVFVAVSVATQGTIQVGIDSVVKSSLGALVKVGPPAIQKLLDSLDLFTLWMLAVLTIGLRAVTKLTGGLAASITLLPWAIFVLLKVAWAAVFG